jgi:hypothetical protein
MDGIQEGGESDTVMNDSIGEQFRDWYERPAARLACSEKRSTNVFDWTIVILDYILVL